MEAYKVQLFETLAVLIVYAIAYFVSDNIINNSLKKTQLQRARRKMIIKAMNLFIFIGVVVVLAGIWGLEQHEIAVFASTLLTALGVAFFAQWSLLSNITSSIILFFYHPLKLGDTIRVMDKDCPFEGEITEMTYFFIYLKTADGEIITVPNSMVLQKSISVIEKADPK
jgi:small-conductance mechanosensitive channel